MQKSVTGIVFLFACSALAQHAHIEQQNTTAAQLLVGLGKLHHPITTSNPLAQRYFDQGLTLVYAFNHEEAARSFGYAAKLDPKCAMAYWGIALARGPNYNESEIDPSRARCSGWRNASVRKEKPPSKLPRKLPPAKSLKTGGSTPMSACGWKTCRVDLASDTLHTETIRSEVS